MVFESMVVDVLNKILGDYVVNLDTKQLKIGIWGGNVELNNLQVRENALDDLNLPFQLTHGYLGKLVLQIPWKNLYGQPVVAEIEDFYATISPKQDVEYNEEKELKFELHAKQAHLEKVDEARKLELSQNKEQVDKSFVEKLTAQIINNLQIKITNVHLRYEDSHNASHPFSIGVTLHDLDIYTTDSNWMKTYITQQVSKVYKIAKLNSLSIYMNCNDKIFSQQAKDILGVLFKENIATEGESPANNKYIIGPISSTAKLILNMTPEFDSPAFEIAKADLDVGVDKLNIGITKTQMQTILKFLDSFNRMQLGVPYRKYKPFNIPYKQNYKAWWKFAITCILEENVKRKKREWSWEHIKSHRELCLEYAGAYKDKELAKKPTATQVEKVKLCEEKLDLFNLVLIRNRIGMEVDRIKLKEEEEQKNKGWFGGWFGGGKKSGESDSNYRKQFEDAMTPAEKEKLYQAIGYHDVQTDLTVPEGYEATKLKFSLGSLEIGIYDDTTPAMRTIMKMSLLQVSANLAQRPAANAIKLTAGIKELKVTGFADNVNEEPPEFVQSLLAQNTNLLDIFFETNPIDKSCDQRVRISSRPLQVTYHYATINELMKVVASEDEVNLSEIEGAASQKMTDFSERSATGLQYMLDKHAIMEIDINLAPINVIVPTKGLFIENQSSLIVLSLGKLSVKSNPRKPGDINKMVSDGMSKDQILKAVLEYAYDTFNVSINDVQLMIVKRGEKWKNMMSQSCGLHIVKPFSLLVNANVCVIPNDPRLPKTKVAIVIPKIHVGISEERLTEALKLLKSLPIPGDDKTQPAPLTKKSSLSSSAMSLINKLEPVQKTRASAAQAISPELSEYIELQLSFVLHEVSLTLNKNCTKEEKNESTVVTPSTEYGTPMDETDSIRDHAFSQSDDKEEDIILCFQMLELEADASKRAFDTTATAKLGAIQLTQYDTLQNKFVKQKIISTPRFTEENQSLLSIKFVMADKKSPEFKTKHRSTEQYLQVDFSILKLVLHKELLLNVMRLAAVLQQKLLDVSGPSDTLSVDRIGDAGSIRDVKELRSPTRDHQLVDYSKKSKRREAVDTINLKLVANLERIEVEIITSARPLASLQIKQLNAGVIIKESCTEASVVLKDLVIHDLNEKCNYSQILSIVGEDVLQVRVAMFNNDKHQYDPYDMRVNVSLGCLRIVFLNLFVIGLQDFMNNFQNVQAAVANASQAAAEAAKQNAKEVYAKASKMKLNIQIKAPLIYMPKHSRSYEAMQLDLGFLSIENNCTDVVLEEDERSPAVIDDMKIHLKDVKFSTVLLSKELDVVEKLSSYGNIWDPFTFSIHLQRNLSSAWYKDRPEINVSGHLNSIVMNLTMKDHQLILSILNKNLSEGADIYIPSEIEEVSEEKDEVRSITEDLTTVKQVKETSAEPKTVFEQIRFNFQFDGAIINLFMNDKTPFAKFGIYFLSLKGKQFDNGGLTTSIVLVDMQLDDLRPTSQGKITRYMCRKESELESSALDASVQSLTTTSKKHPQHMLDLTANIQPTEIFAELRISGFDLIICLDFLLKISDFFAVPEDESPKRESKYRSSEKPAIKATDKPAEKKPVAKAEPEVQKKMKIILHIEEPDIILVESLEDINTNAIILNMKSSLVYRTVGEQQIMTGEISDLKMYMCAFKPDRREQTKHYVIYPCVITLHESMPDEQGMHISLTFSDIIINISPATTELFSKALTTVSSKGDESVEVIQEAKDYSQIWNPEPFEDKKYWFLKCEKGQDALALLESPTETAVTKTEKCVIELPSIVVVFETGFGYYTSPMFNIEFEIHTTVSNWSSKLNVEGDLSLTMQYYNAKLATWEPMIEPNEHIKQNGLSEFDTWTINYSIQMNQNPESEDAEDSLEADRKISITSVERLEVTISKTCLDLLSELGNAFSEAVYSKGLTKPKIIAPYEIENQTGFDLHLDFTKGVFTLHECHTPSSTTEVDLNSKLVFSSESDKIITVNDIKSCIVPHGGRAYLQTKILNDVVDDIYEDTIVVKIGDINKTLILPVKKTDQRYFPLNRDTNQDPWGIVSEVTTVYGTTTIKVRSVVNIHNHFTSTISVFRNNRGKRMLVGEIQPRSTFNVPLHSVYTDSKELYFALPGYKSSAQGFKWNDSPSDLSYSKNIQCDPVNTFESLFINATREKTEIFHENSSKYTILSAYYTIHLRPPVYMRNALPIDLYISVSGCSAKKGLETEGESDIGTIGAEQILDYGERCIKPGDSLQMPIVKIAKSPDDPKSFIVIRLIDYLEKLWSCTTEVLDFIGFDTWTFNSYDAVDKMSMDLGIHYEDRHGSICLTVFSPFWMINKTNLMLSYKTNTESENVLYHPSEYNGAILYAFPEKKFLGKNKAFVRVENGEWSPEMPLNTAGSMGKTSCETNEVIYEIGVQNHLTSNSLTKQITFMPYYTIINKCEFNVEVQDFERPADPWLLLEPGHCSPYWPKGAGDSKYLLRVRVGSHITIPFEYNMPQCSLLRLNNSYGGVNVDVQVTEGGVYITMHPYQPGDAPCLFINNTNIAITYSETDSHEVNYIHPKTQKLFSWSNTNETLVEFNDKDSLQSDLRRDGKGEFKVSHTRVYWVSFLDGLQRVILFSDDANLANNIEDSSSIQKINDEIELSIHGIGISIVNNIKEVDVIYLSITDSGVIWKNKKKGKKRFKQMKINPTEALERQYQMYLNDKLIKKQGKYYLDAANKIEIDFEKMTYNNKGLVEIRRTSLPGVWMSMKSSPNQTLLHVKVNRLQLDNQLFDCIFPVVLAPIPPPKSVGDSETLKPFLECSVVKRNVPNSNVQQFKYASILMQEFHIKVDLMFLNAVSEIFAAEAVDEQATKLFVQDVESIEKPLLDLVSTQSEMEQKNFYDNLHLGPLKIHISFSMAGSENIKLPALIGVLVQSVGVTLTDVNDVVIKLAFFQREYQFYSKSQVISEITTHYSGQFLKQLYVLVLGLDILGNPYGLVVGFTKGATDLFYEPFQGAIQGPSEFAEGLKIGIHSLFSHTIGGAAGAVSKMTGALGKGIAALTCDEDFQKKRRQQQQRKPKTCSEGFARSGKGLATGVYEGVTGVFTKPIAGAKEQGVSGFFKGLGKGAIGFVARPAAGLVDFTSDTFDAVKRATSEGEDANRIRPPRFFTSDSVVRPYSLVASRGHKIFKELEKGKFSLTDIFAHCEEVFPNKEFLILTNNRVMYVVKNETFANFGVSINYSKSIVLIL
ncbi:hypothetical protein ACFFRR_009268 [Megaselia abdita]